MSVSNNPAITLSTYALGSCIAVVAYDPIERAGGMLHLMLPDSKIAPEKATKQPAMFADTGLPMLFRSLLGLRAQNSRLRIFVTGGASVLRTPDNFKIGERNIRAVADYLAGSGFPVRQWSVGGTINRTVHLEIGTGGITLKTPVGNESWSLA
jgi:chemotaxis protein CheD